MNPECWIPVEIQNVGSIQKVKIYNILGQLVREIDSRLRGNDISQISKSVYWDGKDSRGMEVPAGVYFCEVTGQGVRRMIVLR
jgi:flagellar hook assembly protein FlgD